MKIAIIGHGAIATSVVRELGRVTVGPTPPHPGEPSPVVRWVVARPGREDAATAAIRGPANPASDVAADHSAHTKIEEVPDHSAKAAIEVVTDIADLPPEVDLVVDCAGHPGLRAHGEAALRRGFDVLTVSIGALTDETLAEQLAEAARSGDARLHLASGAIGSLDALSAAAVGGLDRVVYIGRKPPAAWRGSRAEEVIDLDNPPAEPCCHFRGDAGEAARLYPKNANVAAAVALAGVGFSDTAVELWADATVDRTIHRVEAEGAFGRLEFEVMGLPLADNPRSSALAAMSVVAHIRRLDARLGF